MVMHSKTSNKKLKRKLRGSKQGIPTKKMKQELSTKSTY